MLTDLLPKSRVGKGGRDKVTVEKPGKRSLGQVTKVTSSEVSHGDLQLPSHSGMIMSLHLGDLPVKNPNLIIRKT